MVVNTKDGVRSEDCRVKGNVKDICDFLQIMNDGVLRMEREIEEMQDKFKELVAHVCGHARVGGRMRKDG